MRLSHHLYNWDWEEVNHLGPHLAQTRATGWEGFEGKMQDFGVPAHVLADLCREHKVACAAVAGGPPEAVDYAHAVGAPLVRTEIPEGEAERWVEYAAARGVSLTVHNHIGRPGLETREDLLTYVEARPGVLACPDTGHLLLCGSDPVRTIRDLGERCGYVHLKDISPEGIGSWEANGEHFWELGTGALDLPGVLRALRDIGYSGWVTVERDRRVRDYVASARAMRATLRELGY